MAETNESLLDRIMFIKEGVIKRLTDKVLIKNELIKLRYDDGDEHILDYVTGLPSVTIFDSSGSGTQMPIISFDKQNGFVCYDEEDESIFCYLDPQYVHLEELVCFMEETPIDDDRMDSINTNNI